MMLALPFVTPLLLIGLLAAGIPFVLHLLSSVRAQEVYFPTLRFLRMSMERTARRRRIQHWLLLLLRAALLALLAVTVAEPISKAFGGWLGGRRYAAVIILDNSMSMAALEKDATRFARAQAQASVLLSGDDKPTLAAVMTTNGGIVSREMTSQLVPLREGVARATTSFDRAPVAQCVAAAVKLLTNQSEPQKAIYIFSDMQRASFAELLDLPELRSEGAEDIHLLIVNTAGGAPNNVGIPELKVSGQAIVNRVVKFSAELVNSQPAAVQPTPGAKQEGRPVEAVLRIEGKRVGQPASRTLAGAGLEGSSAMVHFYHAFSQPGPVSGEVFLNVADDLAPDNVRRFSLTVGGPVRALVVPGPAKAGDAYWLDPGRMLLLALDPFEDASAPLAIRPTTVQAQQFKGDDLNQAEIAFFCEVPAFTDKQAEAITAFVAAGGTAVFFLGPELLLDNYNDLFVQKVRTEGGLLPGRLAEPVGEVGPDAKAKAVDWVDTNHEYFQDLYESRADYLGVLVQRRYRLVASSRPGDVLMRLAGGDPLLLVKHFGSGRVVLCTSTASPRWNNLPIHGLFVPMVSRMSLQVREQEAKDNSYLPGSQVRIKVSPQAADAAAAEGPKELSVLVTLPAEGEAPEQRVVPLPLRKTAEGHEGVFDVTSRLGVYRWRLGGADGGEPVASGAFVVNPNGLESNLEPIAAEDFRAAFKDQKRGLRHVYIGSTVGEVHQTAAAEAEGRNWWDIVAAIVVVVLVAEALVANRRRREDVIPAHLNPRLAA
ncbi:MAG TPA: BatA domain-containing protein [Phycisphaerae bacterium]|nr:BatA domain-containing protein [Phycisphaerae bacterium]